MNQSFCNKCKKLVPARDVERQGKVFLTKNCEKCGVTETLISADSSRYYNKRSLDSYTDDKDCALNCVSCDHGIAPALAFLDITNRCNMNCPICLNNTPNMGFVFDPPLSYFEKIFSRLAQLNPSPAVQLFGGEPTVRDDLIDIIKLAKKYGLRPRVVTNGLKLADKEYCQSLVDTGVKILLAYDGANIDLYKDIRGMPGALDLKLKAIANLKESDYGRMVLMTLFAKGYNTDELPELVGFCHQHRGFISAIYLMPLAHTWSDETWNYSPEQMTTEDVELAVSASYPSDSVEFLPAGFTGQVPVLRRCLRIKPLPFQGVHPNCESIFLMISNGEEYIPLTRYLNCSIIDTVQALIQAEVRLAVRVAKIDNSAFGRLLAGFGLKEKYLFFMGIQAVSSVLKKHLRIGKLLKGKGPGKYYHFLMMMLKIASRQGTRNALNDHSTIQAALEILVIPFEDDTNIETDRMKRCTSAFAYVDPDSDKVKTVPLCSWWRFKKDVMFQLSRSFKEDKKYMAGQPAATHQKT